MKAAAAPATLRAALEAGESDERASRRLGCPVPLVRRMRAQWHLPGAREIVEAREALRPLREPRFPYVPLERFSDAPARCDRCGGPWREDTDGIDCILCGRHLLVAEGLRRLRRDGLA